MTSPPEQISIVCPKCGEQYLDWSRSVNLNLDSFDDDYLDQCQSAVCPECQHKVYFDTLMVKGDTFYYGGRPDEEDEDE